MRPGGHAGSRRKYRDSDFVLAVIPAAGRAAISPISPPPAGRSTEKF
jgi:hypothetical protein